MTFSQEQDENTIASNVLPLYGRYFCCTQYKKKKEKKSLEKNVQMHYVGGMFAMPYTKIFFSHEIVFQPIGNEFDELNIKFKLKINPILMLHNDI